jgi:serine/threonine protein kinase
MAYPAPPETELVARIGSGSVFDVALVRDGAEDEERVLVCKRLTPRMLREPLARAALVREAKALSLAKHPALPALVRVGSDAHGPFVLEERAEGASLRKVVQTWRDRGRPVPPRLVAHIARASIEALAELHELADDAGPIALVHGDLGPDHVLLGPVGEIRVIDFGASRFRGHGTDAAWEDRGTLPFVAPEVARGEAPPSAAGDVYALAATLLFLVASGEPICRARGEAAMLVEIGERGVRVDLLGASDALTPGEQDALKTALAVDPGARLASARASLPMGPQAAPNPGAHARALLHAFDAGAAAARDRGPAATAR